MTQEIFAANYFEIGPAVFDKNIFRIFSLVVMVTRILHEMEIFEQLLKGTPKDHSCEVRSSPTK